MSSVTKLIPLQLILGVSAECADYLFLFFPAEIHVISNLELANHSISEGVNSDIERRGRCHGSKVEIFC